MSISETALHVRPMKAADGEALSDALNRPWHRIDRRWQDTVASRGDMFVAELDGSPVGCVSTNEREECPGMLRLFALDVAPDMQNRGIGTLLVAHIEREARLRGHAGVYLECGVDNHDARRLYERLGYKQDGLPFLNSWNRYDADGNFAEELVETVCRLVKRF